MTTAATSLLGLALPVTGELQGTWGDTVNNSITSLLDTAVAGTTTLSTDGDVTLTTTTLASNQARQAILLCSGARTALRTITAPAQSKIYTIINATTGGFAVKIVGAGPTTGVTIAAGASAQVAWNGSDFIVVGSTTANSLTVSGNLTVNGTTTLTGAATLTANPTLSAGTANGVAYLNGSKVVTTGSALTFDGTNLAGTGSMGTTIAGKTAQFNAAGGSIYASFADGTTTWRIGAGIQAAGRFDLYDVTNAQTSLSVIPGASGYTAFFQNNTEQMRLTSTGLGIGTSSPQAPLDVYSAGNTTLRISGSSGGGGDVSQIDFFRIGSNVTSSLKAIRDGGNTSGALAFYTASAGTNAEKMRLDSSGNLGLGVTPSAWSASYKALQIGNSGAIWSNATGNTEAAFTTNVYFDGSYRYKNTAAATNYTQFAGQHQWYTAASGTAGNAITFTQAMTLDASGNLLVGTTSAGAGAGFATRLAVDAGGNDVSLFKTSSNGSAPLRAWTSTTTGDATFVNFATETSYTSRGSITYNRTGGLIVYGTSSDDRSKDFIGPVTVSGMVIDSVPVYLGKMKGATQARPMFIAHETPEYAHTGEKDAVDADGNPVYQQMDASSLVPVLWAEVQSLRKRLAAAGIA